MLPDVTIGYYIIKIDFVSQKTTQQWFRSSQWHMLYYNLNMKFTIGHQHLDASEFDYLEIVPKLVFIKKRPDRYMKILICFTSSTT